MLSGLQSGRDQAIQVVEASRKDTAQAVAKALEGGKRQAESARRQILGAAELEVRNVKLRSIESSVSEVFESAVKKISSLPDSALEAPLTSLIREGLDVIGPRAVVHCSQKQRKVVASVVRKLNRGPVKLTVEEKGIDTIGGVVLATRDGSVKFDNTFEARLERMRATLRKDVAAILTSSQ